MRVYHTSKETTIQKLFDKCKQYQQKYGIIPDTAILTIEEYNDIDKRYFRGEYKHTIEEMNKGFVSKIDGIRIKVINV